MWTMLSTVFVASLLGSVHCAGMCGGFVAFYAGSSADTSPATRRQAHLAYHGGRLATYAFLGAVAGTLGHALDLAGDAAGLQHLAAVTAGVGMILWGVLTLLRAYGVKLPPAPVPPLIQQQFSKVIRTLHTKPPVVRAAVLGLSTTLLPCGWLYAFAVTAAGTGSPLRGALAMAVFWAGTVPLLAGLGVGIQHLTGPLRQHLPKLTAAALVIVGVMAVTNRLHMPAMRKASTVSAEEQLHRLKGGPDDACCHGN
jgi:sulfite exporter TauE/SafE